MDVIDGIYETHVQVSDLEAAMRFYGETLDLELGTEIAERRVAFYFASDADGNRTMLGLWEVEAVSPSHFAFRVAEEDVGEMQSFLADRGVSVVEDFGIPPHEQPLVHPWMPAAAVYFEDPDGNQLELIAELADDPRPSLEAMPLSEWRALHDSP